MSEYSDFAKQVIEAESQRQAALRYAEHTYNALRNVGMDRPYLQEALRPSPYCRMDEPIGNQAALKSLGLW